MLQNILHNNGLYHNNVKRALFDNYIQKNGNENLLQDWLIICSGFLSNNDAKKKIKQHYKTFRIRITR